MSESPAEPTGIAEGDPVHRPGVGGFAADASSHAEQLVEELQKAKVADLLLHTSSLLASLAYGKLAPEIRDLEQARLAIDALAALGPLLDEAPRRDIEHVTANLKLAYAEAVSAPAADA